MTLPIYKATYSGVPVFEFMCNNIAVMKRRSDSYLNATQILKVAEFDKPQRTRILEREVQTGQHEKVQGGYGKYQGTWVPFERGVALAEHYHVYQILKPIFDFVKGDESPPLAPKHVTAASTKPRKPRNMEPKRKKLSKKAEMDLKSAELSQLVNYDLNHASFDYALEGKYHSPSEDISYKRSRSMLELEDQESHYAHQLLQYFISDDADMPAILLKPPTDLDVNVIIDDEGHTSLHWAAAMGRLKLVSILIELGADIYRVNYKGQTALMRSVLFTNNFDAKTFLILLDMLKKTVFNIDKKDQTVFHHVAATANWKGKVHASRYYMECLIETVAGTPSELISILNVQDVYGNTPLTIAARIGNKKLVRLLIEAGASAEIPNEEGITAQTYLADSRYQLLEDTHTKTDPKLRHTVEDLFTQIIAHDYSQPPIIPKLFDAFSGNFERDLVHKEHVLREKRNELELTKKKLAGTQHTYEQIQYDPDRLSLIEQQSQDLAKLLEKQTLKLQKETLHQLISEHQDESAPCSEVDLNGLLAQLKQLQEQRKQSTERLMQQKLQAPSKRHQEYKRLISMCCNVSYENVDLMLLPLLTSFDELKSDSVLESPLSSNASINSK